MSRLAPRIPARARSKGDVQADVNPDVARPFFYVAARPDGSKKWGIKRVTGPRQLTDQLRRERLVPLNSWGLPGMGGSISGSEASSKDQAELHTQLAQLLTRGVPLVEALEVTASAVSPSMRARVTRMKDLVAAGSSFADACQTVGGLDRVTIAVYRAAERTGDLGGAAKQLSITLRRQLAVAGKALTLMLYPAIVLSISCIVGIGMMTLIVPRIVESIKDVAPDMPWFTMAVYHVGITLRDYFPFFLLAVVGLVALGFVFRGVLAQVMGHLMRTTPLLRDVVLAQESTRFFTVMSAMTKSGVVLADDIDVWVSPNP